MKDGTEVEILMVEDNPADEELALRSLRKKNLANLVHVVRDGAEALDFLFGQGAYAGRKRQHIPKVILLDIKLPKLSGIEVLRRIKSDELLRSLPVVMLTSSREEPDIQECYRLGVNSYIVKPVDFEKFAEVIAQLGLYWIVTNQGPRSG
jgi:two-component system response regulator